MRFGPMLAGLAMPLLAGAAGNSAPMLSAETVTGARFSLAADRGKVVIVNFWATWCVPCRTEMPALDAYYRRHHDDGLEMLAVSIDAGASLGRIRKASASFGFPVARIDDTRIARSDIPAAVPTTRVYGRDGRLRYDSTSRKPAPLDAAMLDAVVGPLLAEAASPTHPLSP